MKRRADRSWGKERAVVKTKLHETLVGGSSLHPVGMTKCGPGPALNPFQGWNLDQSRCGHLLPLTCLSLLHSSLPPRKFVNPLQGSRMFSWKAKNPNINWSPCHPIIRMGPQERLGSQTHTVLGQKEPWGNSVTPLCRLIWIILLHPCSPCSL